MSIAYLKNNAQGTVSFHNVTIAGTDIQGIWSLPNITFSPSYLSDDPNRLENELVHVLVPYLRDLQTYVGSLSEPKFTVERIGTHLQYHIDKPDPGRRQYVGNPNHQVHDDPMHVWVQTHTNNTGDACTLELRLQRLTGMVSAPMNENLSIVIHGYPKNPGSQEICLQLKTIFAALGDAIKFFGKKYVTPFHARPRQYHNKKELLNALVEELKTEGLEARLRKLEMEVSKMKPMLEMANKMRGLFS